MLDIEDAKHAPETSGSRRDGIPVTDGQHGFHNPQLGGRMAAFFDRQLRGMKIAISSEPLLDVKPRR